MQRWLKQWWPFEKHKHPDTPYWNAYLQAFEDQPKRDWPIRNLRFVVLDTETTGLDTARDQILSIGAVAVSAQQIWVADRFEAFLPQEELEKTGTPDTIAVHGILLKHANKERPTAEVLIDFLAYLRGSIFVAHHAAFDFGILQTAYKKHLGGKLLNKTLDTAQLARRLDDPSGQKQMNAQEAKQYSLDHLCHRFNIPIEARHTASGDALLTAILLVKLLARLEARGISSWGELWR